MRVGIKLLATELDDSPIAPDELEQELDQIVEEAVKLEHVLDADAIGTLANGEIEIWVTVEAEHPDHAWERGSNAIRTAIHAAGGATPNWGQTLATSGRKVEPEWTGVFQSAQLELQSA